LMWRQWGGPRRTGAGEGLPGGAWGRGPIPQGAFFKPVATGGGDNFVFRRGSPFGRAGGGKFGRPRGRGGGNPGGQRGGKARASSGGGLAGGGNSVRGPRGVPGGGPGGVTTAFKTPKWGNQVHLSADPGTGRILFFFAKKAEKRTTLSRSFFRWPAEKRPGGGGAGKPWGPRFLSNGFFRGQFGFDFPKKKGCFIFGRGHQPNEKKQRPPDSPGLSGFDGLGFSCVCLLRVASTRGSKGSGSRLHREQGGRLFHWDQRFSQIRSREPRDSPSGRTADSQSGGLITLGVRRLGPAKRSPGRGGNRTSSGGKQFRDSTPNKWGSFGAKISKKKNGTGSVDLRGPPAF